MVPVSTIPDRSLQQRMEALARGNDVRFRRAVMKRDVRAGRVSALEVLAAPPAFTLTMKVVDLLLCVPKVGRVKAAKVLHHGRVSPSKTLGGMSERQRLELIELLS
jgi:hypothetical protein